MKYIRTKDGIIVCENMPFSGERQRNYIIEGDVADTIEELCDEFVYQTSKSKRYIETYLSRNNGVEIINVYGAIWTDKGLIYVAKMNESGCLELL